MGFTHPKYIPCTAKVTYISFVCNHRPLTSEPWRTIYLVIDGDKLSYPEDPGSPAANSFSDTDKGAKFMTLDIKLFFLASPMVSQEYVKIAQKYVPPDILHK